MPNINEFQDRIDTGCRDMLGDTIQYRAAGEAPYARILADVDYGEDVAEFGSASVTVQSIRVSVLKSDVPVKPGSAVRVKLPKLPGKLFAPANVRDSEGGTDWDFELKEENG